MAAATRVLLIDDDLAITEMIEMSLLLDGFHVRTAHNGLEGIKAARELRPNVVVLDLMMPGKDGWDVAHELRADPELLGTPIVVVTARATEDDQWSGWLEGVDSYVTKPFDMDVLRSEIRRVRREPAS